MTGSLLTPLIQHGTMQRTGLSATTTRSWHNWLAHALGIRIQVFGTPHNQSALYVANHISWFDISALGAQVPLRFLSKAEVASWPVLGWLASRAGTLYIKRGAHGSRQAIDAMKNALTHDQNVCLFAEGTTTNGNIRKFHSRLMQSAIDAHSTVQPVAIYYPPQHKLKTNNNVRVHDDIIYIDDISLTESLLRVLKSSNIVAEIHFLNPIDTSEGSRDDLATYCEQQVRNCIEQRHHIHGS